MKSCGVSVPVTRSLFQVGEASSILSTPHQLWIEECDFSEIIQIFEEFHYKGGHMGGGISFCLKAVFQDAVVGGMVIGKPRHENKYESSLEIRRMALLDSCPKNSESFFLAKALKIIKKKRIAKTVISYSDKSVGHIGTIYKAANFKLIGETAPSKHVFWNGVRYHPRSLTIDRSYSVRLREAILDGTAVIETGEPKLIFSYTL